MTNTWPTLFAVTGGFAAAALLGFAIAIGIAYSRWVSEMTYPFLVAAQVLPKVALAPLFLIWFGFGLTPKVVIAALIAFFPIVINTARGLVSVEPELIQYMHSLGANWREVFFKISLPWALPYIFASFRISIRLAVVGAVVGEFVSSNNGLGYVISYANASLDTDVMFAGYACAQCAWRSALPGDRACRAHRAFLANRRGRGSGNDVANDRFSEPGLTQDRKVQS